MKKKNGFCIEYDLKQEIIFEGQYINNKRNGLGIVYNKKTQHPNPPQNSPQRTVLAVAICPFRLMYIFIGLKVKRYFLGNWSL